MYVDVKPISALLRLMTHFANANILGDSSVILQAKNFFDATSEFAEQKILANSGGIMGWPCSHADWIRPGLMLYGISPFSGTTGLSVGLKPVMKLQSKLKLALKINFLAQLQTKIFIKPFLIRELKLIANQSF